jgi:nitroimidazol reductase NimA-like FMN-containing flavoprotein (pyridoxamine 5'-phosphate oxidase superfamily)
MKLTQKEKEFLQCMRVARVATINSNGTPHAVPVCPLIDKDKIYFGTERKARKVRNIEANPNVTVLFDEYSECWDFLRGVMIHGKARIVKTAEFRRLRKRIYAKYLQYESKAALGERNSVIVEIQPESKFSWGL